MTKIKVLALNDDNHPTHFVTLNNYYYDAASFMQNCLLKLHDNEYEISFIALIDYDEDIQDDFMLCADTYLPNTLSSEDRIARQEAFETLWALGAKDDFYL